VEERLMLDPYTKRPVPVQSYEDGRGGRIVVRVEQLERVKGLLDAHGVRYTVDETTLSIDGKPPYGFIRLRRQTDARAVQELLDRSE
jgi:hypothetical protein